MAYQLACKECGTDINAHQYDAYLGLCPACFAEEAELHDDDTEDLFDEHDDADQLGLSGLPFQ